MSVVTNTCMCPVTRAIGVHPELDQVAEELAIRALAYIFADAVNRRDVEAFLTVWDDAGVWEIGAPLRSKAEGAANIATQFTQLWERE